MDPPGSAIFGTPIGRKEDLVLPRSVLRIAINIAFIAAINCLCGESRVFIVIIVVDVGQMISGLVVDSFLNGNQPIEILFAAGP